MLARSRIVRSLFCGVYRTQRGNASATVPMISSFKSGSNGGSRRSSDKSNVWFLGSGAMFAAAATHLSFVEPKDEYTEISVEQHSIPLPHAQPQYVLMFMCVPLMLACFVIFHFT